MKERSAEESRNEYLREMGSELGALYSELWQEIAWLHLKWQQYVELFGTKPERVDLLNRAAPTFFRIVEDSLLEDVLLHIARLTDPPKSAGRANLTLLRLGDLARDDVRDELRARTEEAVEKVRFCRDWRNRRLAHRDLDLALEKGAKPLEPASRVKVRQALESIVATMNVIANHYLASTTFFDVVGQGGDARALLFLIEDGLAAGSARLDRLKRGLGLPEDLRRRDV